MRTALHLDEKDKKRFEPLDPRIFLLLMLCMVIVGLSEWNIRPGHEHQSEADCYYLNWHDNSLKLTEEKSPPVGGLPAHLAPFLFERIAINQASAELLQIIPGIGPELANRIILKREEKGGFSSPEQLLEVHGVGHKRKEKLTAWLAFE